MGIPDIGKDEKQLTFTNLFQNSKTIRILRKQIYKETNICLFYQRYFFASDLLDSNKDSGVERRLS